jgi:hypothetical protein
MKSETYFLLSYQGMGLKGCGSCIIENIVKLTKTFIETSLTRAHAYCLVTRMKAFQFSE